MHSRHLETVSTEDKIDLIGVVAGYHSGEYWVFTTQLDSCLNMVWGWKVRATGLGRRLICPQLVRALSFHVFMFEA